MRRPAGALCGGGLHREALCQKAGLNHKRKHYFISRSAYLTEQLDIR